ncbi:ATP synthase F1 subunit delta [Canibacter sp. lx-72]|uniref:ATP synthase F1 subunit delta n=1 Tax=Canibacter zhuwentaonis TaxID=2837491 RepID=UPI001BDC2912|nr:ATP synthase F1 subunit delta [Canibacter zhuwentaonis]MBT1017641.1 ATP synthase F1 subunit delta [Canibacter zhuwentaonis]
MGSASRESLAAVAQQLGNTTEAGVAGELLQAAGHMRSSRSLAAALAKPVAEQEKTDFVNGLFKTLSRNAREILVAATVCRWSNTEELVSGVESLAVRAAAVNAQYLDEELHAAAEVVDSSHGLELNLGSKLIAAPLKAQLAKKVFGEKVSDSALRIIAHFVAYPAGRKLSVALREAAHTAAFQNGYVLAEVAVASKLDETRAARLQEALSKIAEQPVKLQTVIDPTLVGGVRVKLANEIIDGSISARLANLRLQLAG